MGFSGPEWCFVSTHYNAVSQLASLVFSPSLQQSKPKRSRFSQKHRSDGLKLAQELRQYQRQFPRFAVQINDCIQRIVTAAERTRQSDRDRVLKALKEWEAGLGWRDIVEETGLTEWAVRQVLRELMNSGKVEAKPECFSDVNPTRWRTLYVFRP